MSGPEWRAVLAAGLITWLAAAAEAEPASCSADQMAANYVPGAAEIQRMRCDLDRAALILDRAQALYADSFDSLVRVIDTASPSGAAYVYHVLADGVQMRLEARSVPDGRGPRCRLQVTLPDETARLVSDMLTSASAADLPAYGPREEVTVNPDGSRNSRLVIDSHDIITHAETPAGPRSFSRHAGSDDPVNRLNRLIIGVANVSPDWTCKSS